MADYTSALRTRLIDAAPVAALVAGRIQWGPLPPGTALPYLRLVTISDPRPEHLDGYQSARVTRVQADCCAATYAAARALAEAVITVLDLPATVAGVRFGRIKAEGPRDLSEELPGGRTLYRASVDLAVAHAAE